LRNRKSKIKRQSNCSRLEDIIGAENPILVVANKADLLMNIQTDKVWASTATPVVWGVLGAWSQRECLCQIRGVS
jgi:50S ribosomal subunit-associated GTPase HflX